MEHTMDIEEVISEISAVDDFLEEELEKGEEFSQYYESVVSGLSMNLQV